MKICSAPSVAAISTSAGCKTKHSAGICTCQVSRILRLIKKVAPTYKYYVKAFGNEVITTALKLRELVIIPQLALGFAQ